MAWMGHVMCCGGAAGHDAGHLELKRLSSAASTSRSFIHVARNVTASEV